MAEKGMKWYVMRAVSGKEQKPAESGKEAEA